MSDDLQRFKGILATIAVTRPGISLEEALAVSRDIEREMTLANWGDSLLKVGEPVAPKDDTPVPIAAAWCREQEIVVDYTVAGKHINAIKEARQLSGMGLKAAKDAVEFMRDHLLP